MDPTRHSWTCPKCRSPDQKSAEAQHTAHNQVAVITGSGDGRLVDAAAACSRLKLGVMPPNFESSKLLAPSALVRGFTPPGAPSWRLPAPGRSHFTPQKAGSTAQKCSIGGQVD